MGLYQLQHKLELPAIFPAYFILCFGKKVLYLNHTNSFLESKEYPGYFVGCSPNVGDALTYRIYDDQSKQVVNASVV